MKSHIVSSTESEEPPRKQRIIEKELLPVLRPILDPQVYSEEVPLSQFYAVNLQDKRLIGDILKLVPELPEGFKHLKRVDKKGRVLVEPTTNTIDDDFVNGLKNVCGELFSVELVSVPSEKPTTRKQFEWAKLHWSTAFHPNGELERLVSDTFFTNDELRKISYWIARSHNACIAVQNGIELARGERNNKLLGHAAMNMVSNLAELDRSENEYLATGCDIFLDKEPCGMCAMSLVHARAARIFFRRKCSNGVLSIGKWQLHLEPAINHHYKVFHAQLDSVPDDELFICGY